MMSPTKLLTAEEAAQYLGLHPETVRRMARDQRIPRVKVGRYWRFRLPDLDDWAARGGSLTEGHRTALEV